MTWTARKWNHVASAPRLGRAFTLIELLVVVAILSLLIAILLPSLRAARAAAKQTACAANLHDMLIAWRAYLDENKGVFPRSPTTDHEVHWTYAGQEGVGTDEPNDPNPLNYPVLRPLNPYRGFPPRLNPFVPGAKPQRATSDSVAAFQCPADEGGFDPAQRFIEYFGTSYQANIFLVGQQVFWPPGNAYAPYMSRATRAWLPESKISENYSRLVLVGDGGWYWSSVPASMSPLAESRFSEWHGKKASHNLGFMDGRVVFTRVRKGIVVSPQYTVVPFRPVAEALENLPQTEYPDP